MRGYHPKPLHKLITDPWTLGGAFLITLCLILGLFLFGWWSLPESEVVYPTAIIRVIEAPNITSTSQPTSTHLPGFEGVNSTPAANSEPISIGAFVQISGTEGDGLRLRSNPGLDHEILTIALEAEVFRVEQGPQEASGYTWWYLVAPYDDNIRGWGVADFLIVVQNP